MWVGTSFGGTIIHKNFVLTCAHAFDFGVPYPPLRIASGEFNEIPEISWATGRWEWINHTYPNLTYHYVDVSYVFTHPVYDATLSGSYDIALVKVSRIALHTSVEKQCDTSKGLVRFLILVHSFKDFASILSILRRFFK